MIIIEYIEEVADGKGASTTGISAGTIKSNRKPPVDKENKPEQTGFNLTGTFNQTKKSQAPDVQKTDKVIFSTKDKSFHR